MGNPGFSEQNRLDVLQSFHILDTPPEAIFDRLVELASRICETPIASISLIDKHRQWFKSKIGLDLQETDREIAFCRFTILGMDPFIVHDARKDPRFHDNPLVTGKPGLVFYAGVPLISPQGFAIGTLAVMDYVPRTLTDAQLAVLKMLAEQVMMHIELRRQRAQLESLATERDRINSALVRKTEHLTKAQQLAHLGSWEFRSRGRQLTWSPEITRIFGITDENFPRTVEAFLTIVHPDDRPRMEATSREAKEGRKPFDAEYRIVRPDGEIRHIHALAERYPDDGEQGQYILAGTVQDITVRRKTEQQMHLLKTCVAQLNDIVMITEAEPIEEPGPRIVFVNDAFQRITGYSPEEVLGRSPRFLQGPNTQRGELERVRAALEKKEPVLVEVINYAKDGREFWSEISIFPVAQSSDHFTHFVAIQRDVTDRKKRMQDLAYTTRALQMLTRCNEAMMKMESEPELLVQICRVAVDIGGYRMAWVGYAHDDARRSIEPVAHAGAGEERNYLANVEFSWSEDDPAGCGPAGRCIRSGKPIVVVDVGTDPGFRPWLPAARRYGFNGVIVLPLREKNTTFGLLSLHMQDVRPVREDEILLLQELADNLAFGISSLRTKEEQRRFESAVVKVAAGVSASSGGEFFERLVCNMLAALGADAGFVARFVPESPGKVRTICAVIDRETVQNFDCPVEDSPCGSLSATVDCVVRDHGAELFPECPQLAAIGAHAYVGRRLDSSGGEPLGILFVLFRGPLRQTELVMSTLQIFAARAAAELERQEADARIRDQASLLDKAKDAIFVCGIDFRITYWNKGAERLYGWTAEEALGKTKLELMYDESSELAHATAMVLRQEEWRGENRQRRKDGSPVVVETHWTLVRDEEGKPQSILAINTDITQRKEAEREIERLAFYDSLTRLPNRRLLLDRLEHALATSGRSGHSGALLFIDLDNFKTLNDTLGHDKGDLLLKQVARRLEGCVRKSNTVARLGGDEFVIMLEDLSAHPQEAAAQAEIVGEKVLAAFIPTFPLDSVEHHSSPSIGIALFGGRSDTVDELLKRADLAMYQAKAAGRNAIRFFDPEMQNVVSARLSLEADFRHGLQRQEFLLHYQAQTDGNGHVKGVEALVRWKHSVRGMVSPAAFIPLAEETGLITSLGKWVLETACAQVAAWAARPETSHLSVAVNVSARQFHHPKFVDQVLDVLEYTGADPRHLKLEITESMLVKNMEDTIAKMAALKAKGVGFSLDDFGTGYSSLTYLKRLPLDQLKIDQSFVRDVLVDANDAAIARTIVALGQILGLEVIAEGVETEDQRDFLAQHGCHAYQGYLFSPPLPAEQF
ncbi:EAL domain-containing protein [Noviherbaspirillum massiliense]|uniref:EAL domain-containing protein n=1 Tax=Noviherbaspirillum massiliense TaxID=1465823 RepID=UPI0002EE20C3|nr:EAL domain-containing protein [Noviherbaspirillum massiliense]